MFFDFRFKFCHLHASSLLLLLCFSSLFFRFCFCSKNVEKKTQFYNGLWTMGKMLANTCVHICSTKTMSKKKKTSLWNRMRCAIWSKWRNLLAVAFNYNFHPFVLKCTTAHDDKKKYRHPLTIFDQTKLHMNNCIWTKSVTVKTSENQFIVTNQTIWIPSEKKKRIWSLFQIYLMAKFVCKFSQFTKKEKAHSKSHTKCLRIEWNFR